MAWLDITHLSEIPNVLEMELAGGRDFPYTKCTGYR